MIVWLTSTVSVTVVKNQTINLIIIPLHMKKNLKKKNVNLKTTEVKSFSVHRKRAKPHMQQSATSKNFSACGGLSSSFINSAPSTSNSCIRHCGYYASPCSFDANATRHTWWPRLPGGSGTCLECPAVVCQGRFIVAAVPPGTEDDTVSCVLRLKTAGATAVTNNNFVQCPCNSSVTVSL